jgi:hypothetical protein
MPFSSKYTYLGNTEKIRIPSKCIPHVEKLLEEYNRICGAHDYTYVGHIQNKIEDGLNVIE